MLGSIIADIPLYWLPIWLVMAVIIALWLYQPKGWIKELTKTTRFSLITLRALGLFLLGVLLLGLLLERKEYRKEKPLIVTCLDQSTSMLNYSDSLQVQGKVNDFLQALEKDYGEKRELVSFPTANLQELPASEWFTETTSPIASWLHTIYDGYYGRNIGAVVLISDGNFNQGSHPVQVANRFGNTPIYTVGVGDTIQKKDVLIHDIAHNPIAFLGNRFPVEVSVKSFEFKKETTTQVRLIHKGEELAKKELIVPPASNQVEKITFYIEPKSVGLKEYEVRIDHIENEANYENNTQSFFIEVLDARSKVLLLAGAPHPDIGAIKTTLMKDQNLEVQVERIQNLPENLNVFDLIIWHDPGVNTADDQFATLEKSAKPIWFIFGPNSDAKSLTKLGLPLLLESSNQVDEVKGALETAFSKFQFSDDGKEGLRNLPPLTAHYGNLKINTAVDVLFKQKVGNVVKEDPLFFFGSHNGRKFAFLFGEGLWRWRLGEFQQFKRNKGFDELIAQTVQYLSVRSDASRLKVQLPKQITDDQPMKINATFYNESYQAVTDADIQFTLINSENEETSYDFLPSASNYLLSLGRLPQGIYEWKAVATNKEEVFEKSGSFIVRSLALEDLDTKANHNVLFQVSTATGGRFYPLAQIDELLNELSERDDIAVVSYESTVFKKLIDYWWLFFTIVSLFVLEWFLRRYNGAY